MKKCISVVSLLLAVVMIALCCAACGDSGKATIVNKWTTELEMDKYIDAASAAASAGQLAELMKQAFGGVSLKIYMTFNEDGTCVLAVDEASASAASAKLAESLSGALAALGVSEDQISEMISGFDITSLVGGTTAKYETDGNKLYIYEDQKNDANYVEFELTSSELKITKGYGADSMIPAAMLPIVLTKVS